MPPALSLHTSGRGAHQSIERLLLPHRGAMVLEGRYRLAAVGRAGPPRRMAVAQRHPPGVVALQEPVATAGTAATARAAQV